MAKNLTQNVLKISLHAQLAEALNQKDGQIKDDTAATNVSHMDLKHATSDMSGFTQMHMKRNFGLTQAIIAGRDAW